MVCTGASEYNVCVQACSRENTFTNLWWSKLSYIHYSASIIVHVLHTLAKIWSSVITNEPPNSSFLTDFCYMVLYHLHTQVFYATASVLTSSCWVSSLPTTGTLGLKFSLSSWSLALPPFALLSNWCSLSGFTKWRRNWIITYTHFTKWKTLIMPNYRWDHYYFISVVIN